MRVFNQLVYRMGLFAVLSVGLISSAIAAQSFTSQTVTVSGARYLQNMANTLEGNQAYSRFIEQVASRRRQTYQIDNDGVLRAFDATTHQETYTFTPTVLSAAPKGTAELSAAQEDYPAVIPVVADIYDGTHWRTILVGTLGARGQGLFALDITNPDAIQLLWELDSNSDALKDVAVKLGYSFAQPTIARLHHGRWAVVVGNGYQAQGGESGAAALYLLDAIDGSLIKSLEVQSDLAQANGLSAPRLADYDADGIADYAYAGDLHGNLWRFDLFGEGATGPSVEPVSAGSYGAKSGSSSRFNVSYAGRPLFVATTTEDAIRQPIVAAPSLVPHPTGTGYVVVLGTGLHAGIESSIDASTLTHSLYGIWDRQTSGQATTTDTVTANQLTRQTISSTSVAIEQATDQQRQARVLSQHAIAWYTNFDSTQAVKQRGWRLDLKTADTPTGEMLLDTMRTLGSMLLVQTQARDSSGVQQWLYAINPSTGGAMGHDAFALQTPEVGIVSAIEFAASAPGASFTLQNSEEGFVVKSDNDQARIAAPPESMGRQSWRMISSH